MAQAYSYVTPGSTLHAVVVHPDSCGAEQEHCTMGAVLA